MLSNYTDNSSFDIWKQEPNLGLSGIYVGSVEFKSSDDGAMLVFDWVGNILDGVRSWWWLSLLHDVHLFFREHLQLNPFFYTESILKS